MEHTNRLNREKKNDQLTINIGRGTLSFTIVDSDGASDAIPYTLKSGISIAANLREAFKTCEFLEQASDKANVYIDGDILMVPINLFEQEEAEALFFHAFPDRSSEQVFCQVLTELHAVAISSINKDLRTVLEDHFQKITLLTAMAPTLNELYHQSFTGNYRKLFGYFHEKHLDIISFHQNRFKFFNSFEIKQSKDAVFFLLYVWKQLRLDAKNDELHLSGTLFQDTTASSKEMREELLLNLQEFISKVKTP